MGGPSNFSVNQSLKLWNLELKYLDLDFGLGNRIGSKQDEQPKSREIGGEGGSEVGGEVAVEGGGKGEGLSLRCLGVLNSDAMYRRTN